MRDISDSPTESKFEGKRVLLYALPAGAPRVARLITLKLPALPYYSGHEASETTIESEERYVVRTAASKIKQHCDSN